MHEHTVEDFLLAPVSLFPVRGLVCLHNAAGQGFAESDLHRAIRYQCHAFQVLKLDLACTSRPSAGIVESCLDFSREYQVAVSLRMTATAAASDFALLKARGLVDVCVATASGSLPAWAGECRAAGLPLRIETASDLAGLEVDELAEAGVRLVTSFHVRAEARREALAARGISLAVHAGANLDDAQLAGARLPESYFRDHQQYQREAFAHAMQLHALRPVSARARLMFDTFKLAGIETPSDRWLVHFLRVYTPFFRPVQTAARALKYLMVRDGESQGHAAPSGEAAQHPAYFDAIDLRRLKVAETLEALRAEARAWEGNREPGQVFESATWGFENVFHDPMPGVNRMHVLLGGERRSSKLPYLRLPFMVEFTVGGGVADAVGFSIGRPIRLACPMVGPSHRITLYADREGQYVLLRDGQVVLPMPLEGKAYIPARLPDGVHLQATVWSPETSLSVSALRVWQGHEEDKSAESLFDVSVVVFSTRFARRLQAALDCLVHQQGIALDRVQCVVGIAPGLDAAEDVLDSFQRVHPALQIERVYLPLALAHAKGFALNECFARARGPLIIAMDSDILLPPRFVAEALGQSRQHAYLAPGGRAMLDANATARILLGTTLPWEQFDELRASAPEFRVEENPQHVPIGYCQVFPSSVLREVRYAEYDHFQGADFEFGAALRDRLGAPRRMSLPVLHLDHGTRQWFGAQKHF